MQTDLDMPSQPSAARHFVDRRTTTVAATPEVVFLELERMGGSHGWPYANVLWQVRGWIDRLAGGVGMRGHPAPGGRLVEGEALDFWLIERVDRPGHLLLRAEMRLPGKAWLEFDIERDGLSSRLTQTARFVPHGLAGWLYWYGLLPVHVAIFRGMVRRLAARALITAETPSTADNGPLDSGQGW